MFTCLFLFLMTSKMAYPLLAWGISKSPKLMNMSSYIWLLRIRRMVYLKYISTGYDRGEEEGLLSLKCWNEYFTSSSEFSGKLKQKTIFWKETKLRYFISPYSFIKCTRKAETLFVGLVWKWNMTPWIWITTMLRKNLRKAWAASNSYILINMDSCDCVVKIYCIL